MQSNPFFALDPSLSVMYRSASVCGASERLMDRRRNVAIQAPLSDAVVIPEPLVLGSLSNNNPVGFWFGMQRSLLFGSVRHSPACTECSHTTTHAAPT